MEVSVAGMKELEKAADAAGLSYLQMMENAGVCAARVLMQYEKPLGKVYVFCGKGNNGGDGFVAARVLAQSGAEVTVVLTEGSPKTPDACTNLALCRKEKIRVLSVQELTQDDQDALADAAVIDGMYGTGFHGEMRSEGRTASQLMGKGRFVLALDLPSGLQADTGIASEGAVKADVTVTFHAQKACHRLAKEQCGTVITADIGIEKALSKKE